MKRKIIHKIKKKMMAQNIGQHVIVTIGLSFFPGLHGIYVYGKIISKVFETYLQFTA